MSKIITISREFGSGGREIGKRLADELGFAYYDSEIIEALAKDMGMDEKYLENVLEGSVNRTYPITYSRSFLNFKSTGAQLMAKQHEIIKRLAKEQDCIIVGRGADVVLKEHNPFRIFVYADMKSKLERCRKRAAEDEKLSDAELMKKIRQIDKNRLQNHNLFSDIPWGQMEGYDLCLNSSKADIKCMVPILADYIRMCFREND